LAELLFQQSEKQKVFAARQIPSDARQILSAAREMNLPRSKASLPRSKMFLLHAESQRRAANPPRCAALTVFRAAASLRCTRNELAAQQSLLAAHLFLFSAQRHQSAQFL